MAKITNQSSLTSKYTTPDGLQNNYTTQSNVLTTENMTTSFLKEKTADKDYGFPKDELTITLTLTNNSQFPITNITISDSITPGATFKQGTIMVDNILQPTFDITGFTLPQPLQPNTSATVTYTLVVDDAPATTLVKVRSNIEYIVEGVNLTEHTDEVSIAIEKEEVTIAKTSNKSAVISGDRLMFQNDVKNLGNILNTDVQFYDPIPAGTTFEKGSVEIDGTKYPNYDPQTGFKLDDLSPGKTITIRFFVTVD